MNRYALVDANNFFVSCERVFQPRLEKQPVVVLSNNDGCIISRSNEAKQLGIPMGAPYFKWKSFLVSNNVKVFSSNYELYGDMSSRIMSTIASMTDQYEVYSIDECFIKLNTDWVRPALQFASQLRARILQWTGIPCSIGISSTKTLAKVANKYAKKASGILELDNDEQIIEYLSKTPIRDIWGVGSRLEKRLMACGINTAMDLRQMPELWVSKEMKLPGLRTVKELKGIACVDLEMEPAPKKSIASTRSFGRPVKSKDELEEAIALYTSRAAEKMRSQKSCCSAINVFIRTNYFNPNKPQYGESVTITFERPRAYTPTLIEAARRGLRMIYKEGYEYQKAGIMLLDLSQEQKAQTGLFTPVETEKQKRLMEAVDSINKKLGKGTVKFLSQGVEQSWQMKRDLSTPKYTTKWEDILSVG